MLNSNGPTDYSVVLISGKSNGGGDPDVVANKIISKWNLVPADGILPNLFKNAVPPEGLQSRYMLRVWGEGEGKRAQLLFDDQPDPINLDRGQVLSERELNHDSGGREFVFVGNYLFRITVECGPAGSRTVTPVQPVQTVQSIGTEATAAGIQVIGQVLKVPVRLVRPMRGQPRKYFDPVALKEFGDNLKEQGQIQPAIVRKLKEPDEHGCLYELISGERRWRACQLAGIPELKIILGEGIDHIDQFVQAVIANCHGVELSLLETMQSVGYLAQCGKNDVEIAKIFGKRSALWAWQHRRALTLDPSVLKLLGPETSEEERIPLNSAILLINIPREEQLGFAEMISKTGMSAKQVNHLVKNRLAQCGIERKSRSSVEFDSLIKFFLKANAEIELLIDHEDGRITNMFKGRDPEQLARLLRLVRDCRDNLGVVQEVFVAEIQKAQQ